MKPINPKEEVQKITNFIQSTLKKQNMKNVVIAMSGGIDSATSFSLLAKSIDPKHIFVIHMPYEKSSMDIIVRMVQKTKIPKKNVYEISIKKIVDAILVSSERTHPGSQPDSGQARMTKGNSINSSSLCNNIRHGNSMARVRMILLYDLAKKQNALVCGTENKSEYYLGYYTRFGDEASDFEPIRHLYKTQIYDLARYLQIPAMIINKNPSAGLWKGQTDEKEFGFTYTEADQVLYQYYEKKQSVQHIVDQGFKSAEKIINFSLKNFYKHKVPYCLE